MIILNLNQFELMTLSSFSKIKVAKNSPMFGRYIQNILDFKTEGFNKAYNSFCENTFLVDEGAEKTLAPELEAPFLIFHQPDVSISFKRLSEVDYSEICFSFRNDFVLQYMANKTGSINTLIYPLVLPSVGAWVRESLLSGLNFDAESIGGYETLLNIEELMVLFILLSIMKERIDLKNDSLTQDECFVDINQIKKFSDFERLNGLLITTIGTANLKKYLKKSDKIDEAITSLYQKGLMSSKETYVSLSEFAKKIFNPGKLQDSIVVGEFLPDSTQFTTLNVMTNGYVLIKLDTFSEEVVCRLHTLPSDSNITDVFKELCPNAFAHGFGDEEKYRQLRALEEEQFQLKMKSPIEEGGEPTVLNGADNQQNEISSASKFCIYCGAPITKGSAFCISCGQKLT